MSTNSTDEIEPYAVKLLDEKEIIVFLELNTWRNYKGTVESFDEDNRILQHNIQGVLNLKAGFVNDLMSRIQFKAMGQHLGVDGLVTAERQLPTRQVRIINPSDNQRSNLVEIVDFDNEKIIKFAGMNQLDYLIYNLYFLLERYWSTKTGHFNKEFMIDPRKLELLLEEEIRIVINAYLIRRDCENVLESQDPKALSVYLRSLIEHIHNTDYSDFRYCIPCGSRKHAVYITLLCFKSVEEVVIRIDNSSREKTTVLGNVVIQAEAFEQTAVLGKTTIKDSVLFEYLKNAILQLREENTDTAMREIYNQRPHGKYIFNPCPNEYTSLSKQTALNCVVEGFRRGMWYRLWERYGTPKDTIYMWLVRKSNEFASLSHAIVDRTFFRETRLRDKIDNNRFQHRYPVPKEDKSQSETVDIDDQKVHSYFSSSRAFGPEKISNIGSIADNFKSRRLEDLRLHIKSLGLKTSETLLCAITGVAGCGKTELAKAYATDDLGTSFRWRLDPDNTSTNSVSTISYLRAYAFLRGNLKVAEALNPDEMSRQRTLAEVWAVVSQYKEWIIIFDNATSHQEITHYLQGIPSGGTVLITTQTKQFFKSQNHNSIRQTNFPLDDGLQEDDAIQLLRELSSLEDPGELGALVNRLDRSPLGIIIAGYYIRNVPGTSYQRYLELLDSKEHEECIQKLMRGSELATLNSGNKMEILTLHKALYISILKVIEHNSDLFELLKYCSFLGNEKIPSDLLVVLWDKRGNDNIINDEKLKLLTVGEHNYSMVTFDTLTQTYGLHRSTQDVLRIMISSPVETLRKLVETILKVYPPDPNSEEMHHRPRRVIRHFVSLEQNSKLHKGLIMQRVGLLSTLGTICYDFMEHNKAIWYVDAGLTLLKETKPNDPGMILKVKRRLNMERRPSLEVQWHEYQIELLKWRGFINIFRHKYEESLIDLRASLEDAKSEFKSPQSKWRIAVIYCYIGHCNRINSKAEIALPDYQKALKICKSIRNPSKDDYVAESTAYNGIGNCLKKMERYSEAMRAYKKSVKLREDHLGKGHVWTATASRDMSTLGLESHPTMEEFTEVELKYDDALKNVENALKVHEKVYGENTPYVAIDCMYASLMLHAKNETLRSLEYANQAIDIYHKIYGTDHRELIQLHYLKGRILQRRSQIEQSVESYRQTLRISKLHPGKYKPQVVECTKYLQELEI